MTKTVEEKIIKEAANYIWGRIKVIILMIILLVVVKEHPGWDAFFVVILMLQVILSVLKVINVPSLIVQAESKAKGFDSEYYKRFFEEHRRRSNYQNNKISFTNDISTSAKLLGVNIIQDDEDTIKKKYRKLAMKWHPDKYASDTPENQEIAKRNFQKVSSAYQKIKEYKNII